MVLDEKKVILIADDDDDDLMFAERAIKAHSSEKEVDIHFVKDGEELLDYIYRRNGFDAKNAPKPDVIFLDIKMPKLCGLSVLESIKNDKDMKSIPIIVLSSSETDIDPSYNRGANSYLVKPSIYHDLEEMMGKVKKFWFEAAKLPGGSDE